MQKRSLLFKLLAHTRIQRKVALGIAVLFPLYMFPAHATETASISNITILSYSGGSVESGTFYAGSDAGCRISFSLNETVSANSAPATISYTIGGNEYSVSISGSETTLPLPANQSGPLTIQYYDGTSQVSRSMEYIVSENGLPVISAIDVDSSDGNVLSFTIEDTAGAGTVISGLSTYECYIDEQPVDSFTTEELAVSTLENGLSAPSLVNLALTLPDLNAHTIRITAADKCGNTCEYTFTTEGSVEQLSEGTDETGTTEEEMTEEMTTEEETTEEVTTEEGTTEEMTTEEETTEEMTTEEASSEESPKIISVLLPTDFTMLMYKLPDTTDTLVESQDIPFINTGDTPVKVNITAIRFDTNDNISGSNTQNLSFTLKQYNKEDQFFTISEEDESTFYSITLEPNTCDASSLLERAGHWNPLGEVTSDDYATLRINGNLGNGEWRADDISVRIIFEIENVSQEPDSDAISESETPS